MKFSKTAIKLASGAALSVTALSAVAPIASVVYANDATVTNGRGSLGHQNSRDVDGKELTGGKITIKGNENQSMKNKKFEIFKLFNVENAAKGESVNYTFNPVYKEAIQKVVMAEVNKRDAGKPGFKQIANHSEVSEYRAIDYIQTLNTHIDQNATKAQQVESRTSQFRYFVEKVRNQIKADGLKGDVITVNSVSDKYGTGELNITADDNKFELSDLAWGYYMIDEISTVDRLNPTKTDEEGRGTDNQHFAASLVMVNTANAEFTIQLKSDYPVVTKKIHEDDTQTEINAALADKETGKNDIGDYEIGQTVPYTYDSTIPDMNGYKEYIYAWHDKMDPALTFVSSKDDINIKIYHEDGREYVLKASDYKLNFDEAQSTAGGSETLAKVQRPANERFVIEIADMKALVDANLNPKANAYNVNPDATGGHNTEKDYTGFKVRVEYKAILNSKAAYATGRPGFENDVRLEFSNDPDNEGTGGPEKPGDTPKTGYTPWDTVVAFTFKGRGIKINENNLALKDAHFKIYRDKEMTDEVKIVKLNDEQYNTRAEAFKQAQIANGTADAGDKGVRAEAGAVSSTDARIPETETDGSTVTNIEGTTGTTENLSSDNDGILGGSRYAVVHADTVNGNSADNTKFKFDDPTTEFADYIQSDENGNFTIIGLDQGTYYIKEVKAPVGYRLLEQPIKLEVKPTYTTDRDAYIKGQGATEATLTKLDAAGEIVEFYDEIFKTQANNALQTNVADGSFDFKVINKPLSKLPATGAQIGIATLIGGGVLISLGGYSSMKRKKDQA